MNQHEADYSISEAVFPQIKGYRFEHIEIGKTAASVFRLSSPNHPTLFLKSVAIPDVCELKAEFECLVWLANKIEAPRIVGFKTIEDRAMLLTEALPGVNAVELPDGQRITAVVELAQALKRLHAIDASQCPFNKNLSSVVELVTARAEAGLVDESDFDEERRNCTALDLLAKVNADRPRSEDLVVTHGDPCLSNIIIYDSRFSGFVDCGRCGIADRHHDLALASRSIASNYGEELVPIFFDNYDAEGIDERKLEYYRLLDEFF